MALFDTIRAGASAAGEDTYEIERSLRFNGGYFSKSPNGNSQKFTISVWLKRARLGSHTMLVSAAGGNHPGGADIHQFGIDASDRLFAYAFINSNSQRYNVKCNHRIRDTASWYHIVYIYDSGNSTSSNRIKLFINGELQTDLNSSSYPSSGENNYINNGYPMVIGHESRRFRYPYYGYMAEFYFLDGQALDPTNFAETKASTNQYVPIEYTGSFSGTSFYLDFEDNSSTSNLGNDVSGLSNNWSANSFSVSTSDGGINNDSFIDSPTNNHCTINQNDHWRGSTEVEDGNLKFRRHSNNFGPARGTFPINSGKWYFEFRKTSGLVQAGFATAEHNLNYNGGDVGLNSSGSFPGGMAYDSRGFWYGFTGSSPSSIGNGDIIGVAFDADNFKFYFHKNGTYYGSGNPSTGSNGITPNASNQITYVSGTYYCPYFNGENGQGYANFGQRDFAYSIPTGYKKLSASELPDPSIKLPAKYLNTILYTGTGSSQDITGLDFSPDLVWVKKRNGSDNHNLANTVRGAGKSLRTSTTGNETSSSGAINAFLSNGFRVVDAGETNENGNTYAAWNWDGGGSSTSADTNGSITTQVSANQTAGFSIFTFTYHTSGTATIGHGLNAPPKWIMSKSFNGTHWVVYHSGVGPNRWENLSSNAWSTGTAVWNNQLPTSSVVNLGFGMTNQGAAIAFAWTDIPGFSQMGFYHGNGNNDGPFVPLGFKPAWVMYKNVSQNGGQWFIRDNQREPDNPNNSSLAAESAGAEVSNNSNIDIDFCSNGIKWRQTNEGSNNNNIQYVYIAFASHPLKYSNAV